MAEFTELFPVGKQMDGLMHMYVYIITFDFPTFIVICLIITLFFFIFYQILHGMFYWFMELRPNELRDLEQGTQLGYPVGSISGRVTVFHALVLSNLQAWTMVTAAFEEGDHYDENRGQRLRALKKLPALVKYGKHDIERSCNECAICLDDFQFGQLCQVFPVCEHIFHSDCIDKWLQKKLTCPICRRCILD